MSINLSHFGLAINAPFIGPNARSFRPPNWPPPKDWVCIEDKEGNPVSRVRGSRLGLDSLVGNTMVFNFGDGPKRHARSPVIDPANAEILRQLVTWRAWGLRAAPAVRTLLCFANSFGKLSKFVVITIFLHPTYGAIRRS